MLHFTKAAAAAIALLAVLPAAADEAKAKKKLDKEGIAFTAEKFLWEVTKEEPKTVALFLEAGMSPDTADDKGVTALHRAAGNAEGKVLALLLKAGANPNAAAGNGDTPLCEAVDEPAPGNVAALLAAGADPKPACAWGKTALHIAGGEGDGGMASALLAAGAPLEARDQHLQTPLYFALRSSRPDALKVLVAAGADVNAKFKNGQTPLHEAVTSDAPGSAEILLEAGAKVEAKDSQGQTPLYLAAAYGREKMVPVLLRYGADPAQKTPNGKTLVQLATESKSPNVIPLLEGAKKVEVAPKATIAPKGGAATGAAGGGGPAASADPKGDLAKMGLAFDAKTFFSRVDGGDTRAIALFLAAGFDASTKDDRGRTGLWIAVEQKNADSVRALLSGGVKPDAKNAPPMAYGQTIVAAAVASSDAGIVRALVEAGADAKKGNDYGMTPLHEAARQGQLEATGLLLKAGADPNSAPSGAPVLHGPVTENHVEVVKLLLDSGAKVAKFRKLLLETAKTPEMKALLQKAP
jgi:ankyrin repeat protein